jgi:hypothetical protein
MFVILLFLLINSCQKQSTGIDDSLDQISFSTDTFSYTELDTINLFLENESDYNIIIGLRCGGYLEMFFQKKENRHWSDNLWFWYMSLRCPTSVDTVQSNSRFTHSIPAEIFNSKGTFRLLVDVYIPERNSSETIISNAFKIE